MPSKFTDLADPKLQLILSAEQLFGDFGIEGVSLRRVSEHAGNKNVCAAQYHFGSKEDLLTSVLAYRRQQVDQYRHDFFQKSGVPLEKADIDLLVMGLAMPLFNPGNSQGRQSRQFCRFLRGLIQSDAYVSIWKVSFKSAPFTNELNNRLRVLLSHLCDDVFHLRMISVGNLIVNMIADYDRGMVPSPVAADYGGGMFPSRLAAEDYLTELVAMSSAALAAPMKISALAATCLRC